MRYLTFDGKKYRVLDDGVAFDVRWDATNTSWRLDVMSVTEREKTDVTKRKPYDSVLLKDILPASIPYGSALITWNYLAQTNTVLTMFIKATTDAFRHVFSRPYPARFDFSAAGNMYYQIKTNMLTAIRKEHNRLGDLEHERRRGLYSIAFSNATTTSITLTVSGGPTDNTSRWEARYRPQGRRYWQDLNRQVSNVFNIATRLSAGGTYEFEARRTDDTFRHQEVWSQTHTRILPTQ